mgnify:CR=1 FL=1
MACRQIVEIYDTLIEQMDEKIGETIHLIYPKGTNNVIAKNYYVSALAYNTMVGRRNKLVGGK